MGPQEDCLLTVTLFWEINLPVSSVALYVYCNEQSSVYLGIIPISF